jgi:CheY-like chemotaxis protein
MDTQRGPLLIVEDIPDTRKLVELTLTYKGYRVITATNGQEALEAIEKERPSLIVTDILMPRMDGFSLVHRLRVNPETRDIPVIFLSATYVAAEDKIFAEAIGVTRFIEKPIDMEELLKSVSEYMSRREPSIHQPLNERDFYNRYRERLETKLRQKIAQITRVNSMMETLSENEKRSFQTSLKTAINERDEIQQLLIQIRKQLEENDKSK